MTVRDVVRNEKMQKVESMASRWIIEPEGRCFCHDTGVKSP